MKVCSISRCPTYVRTTTQIKRDSKGAWCIKTIMKQTIKKRVLKNVKINNIHANKVWCRVLHTPRISACPKLTTLCEKQKIPLARALGR